MIPHMSDLDIFLACPPGLEPVLCDEAAERGFAAPKSARHGITNGSTTTQMAKNDAMPLGTGRPACHAGAAKNASQSAL